MTDKKQHQFHDLKPVAEKPLVKIAPNEEKPLTNNGSREEKPLISIKTGNRAVDSLISHLSRFVSWFQAIPAVAHFIRAGERFTERLGSQFGAAITYFSFLSLIPILMVSFAAAGFVLQHTRICLLN